MPYTVSKQSKNDEVVNVNVTYLYNGLRVILLKYKLIISPA